MTENEEIKEEVIENTEENPKQDEIEEIVVTVEGEEPEEEIKYDEAPEWVRDLRKQHKELKKENQILAEKLNATVTVAKPKLGVKPTLELFDYDAEEYEQALTKWFDAKRAVDAEEAQIEAKKRKETDDWNTRLASYSEAKKALKVSNYDEAEDTVRSALSTAQQGIILQASENPSLLVYALGKNPKKLKELAAIEDHVKYTFQLAKMEAALKVTSKNTPPAPEKKINGGGTGAGGGATDSTLERLRADADKSGDYTKVLAYKRNKKSS